MIENGYFSYKNCRKRASFTQSEAYVLLDLPEASILSKYETGKNAVPDETVKKMVHLYGEPNLVTFHLRNKHPDFADYIPYTQTVPDYYEKFTRVLIEYLKGEQPK